MESTSLSSRKSSKRGGLNAPFLKQGENIMNKMILNLINSWLLVVLLVFPNLAFSKNELSYENSGSFSSQDYLLRSYGDREDPLFGKDFQIVDLNVDLGFGADCGKVDFKSTMRSSLKNLLDAKYFGDLGRDIVGASPLLLTCYFSPTWCAILKHLRTSAHYVAQMRLDQCALIDKYTDDRAEDFYKERQSCVRQKIKNDDGDLESAMDSCKNVYDVDLANWAGKSQGEKAETNRLIESSAKWAGLDGEEAEKAVGLTKAFVGDTVVSKGQLSVDYGPRKRALTPYTHLAGLQKAKEDDLCEGLLKKVENESYRRSVDEIVSDSDLNRISGNSKIQLIDRQTIEALVYMPRAQRLHACKKLADGIALTIFTNDLNRSLDVLTVAAQNPNLPPHRRQEIERKRQALKESVEMTLELQKQRNEPLNRVVSQINRDGTEWRTRAGERVIETDSAKINSERTRMILMDCADGIMCERGGK